MERGMEWRADPMNDSQVLAELWTAQKSLEEANRQLALYRKFVNRLDDDVEYAKDSIGRAQLHKMMAKLTQELANTSNDDSDPETV
jgi:hypothetical protein